MVAATIAPKTTTSTMTTKGALNQLRAHEVLLAGLGQFGRNDWQPGAYRLDGRVLDDPPHILDLPLNIRRRAVHSRPQVGHVAIG